MTITYAPCNFCGASLVKHQADLTNAGVKGFECPLKLESNRQEKNLDAWALVTAAWEEAFAEASTIFDGEVEATAERIEQAFAQKPGQVSLKEMAKRIHKEQS